MTIQLLHRAIRYGYAATILAALLGAATLASANNNKPTAPTGGGASHAASTGGNSGGGSHTTIHNGSNPGQHQANTGGGTGSHTTTTGGSHAWGSGGGGGVHGATGGAATHGPTANGGGTHSVTSVGGTGGSGAGASHGAATNGPTANGGGTTHGATTTGTGAGTHGATTMSGTGAGTHGATTNAHTTTGTGTHGATTTGGHPVQCCGGSAPKGSHEQTTKGGGAVRTRPNGRVSDVHDPRRGVDVHHGLNGNRSIERRRPDGGRFVSERGRRGYAERGYSYHGHDFGRRAYYYHGHEYNRYYRGWGFRGLSLSIYAPGVYFGPGFYGWAYNPWAAPIAFGWGWRGNPWFGFYGGYFQPYAVYPSAAFWLTDYIVSQDLQAAYAAHQEAGENDGAPQAAGGPPELTPDVKQQIADEVRAQLALENSEAQQNAQHQDVDPGSSGIARMLGDGHRHIFVAGGPLDLTDVNGQECAISDGDVLQLQTPPPSDATSANLVVLASKGGQECAKANTVAVQLTDLQEMQNSMRETIDQGLQELQAKQGKGGLPPAPPSAQAPPAQTDYAQIAPPASPQDATDLQQQDQQADQSEKDVTTQAAQDSSTPAAAAPPAQ